MPKSNQPSPLGLGFHASKQEEGTIMRGKDGMLWVVKVRDTGSHFWARRSESIKGKTIGKGPICIFAIEPTTFLNPGLTKERVNEMLKRNKLVCVSVEFAKKILSSVKRINTKHGCKYIFGPSFPRIEYLFVESPGNDVAQMGLISVGNLFEDISRKDFKERCDKLEKLGKAFNYEWFNRKFLLEVRKLFPCVLFIGDTPGGDVGADFYVHVDSHGVVNGLLLEI